MHGVKAQKLQKAHIAHLEARLSAVEKALGITPAPQGTEPYPEAAIDHARLAEGLAAVKPSKAAQPMANPPAGK